MTLTFELVTETVRAKEHYWISASKFIRGRFTKFLTIYHKIIVTL